ncbi:EAL domain-containing protein [Aurantiacibacter aquimixticola]|uniref:EAL domain-containing protein n=1 Tax=Aurantiacibacter aquimixticola TaxID=1958945 RepID=A0A419RU15_9SPHN|nr:EAL domain-containing protein [Aurantiacibacter aquimixticola]RJY09276.1 EAL domain-containing protein [Aurantiacibacter aquimixticola]
MADAKPKKQRKARRLERLKHAVWAGAIALVLGVLTLLHPIDQVFWAMQSRAVSEPASGEFVYVSDESDFTDPDYPERRRQLAQAIRQLNAAGANRIFVDGVFDTPTNAEVDRSLNEALRSFEGEAFLVQKTQTGIDGQRQESGSVEAVADGVQPVGSDLYKNFMGLAWDAQYEIATVDGMLPNLSAKAARIDAAGKDSFPIAYDVALETLPTLTLRNVAMANFSPETVEGKTIVVGSETDDDRMSLDIPGLTGVSSTLVQVLAAESLFSDRIIFVPWFPPLMVTIILLLAVSQLPGARLRRIGYAVVALSAPIALLITAYLGWRVSASDALALLGVYGFFRLRTRWKDSFALVDPETNLPTFAAMEGSEKIAQDLPAIIVAKIHRFEQVRRTLPKEMHSEYVLRIISRLKAATQDATIHIGQGHMIAWTMGEKEPGLLQEHLEGLRALFSAPLIVGDQQVDVGITFGVDITPSPNIARRLASAVDVAEQTNETYDPLIIADATSEEDLIWNISLQARIDAALGNGEIFLAYQPKIMVQTGEVIGVEALVRWRDPAKGLIPPDSFIRQCETAGRMTHLTRFVLEEACRAGNAFEDAGHNFPVAVNISATLMHEDAVVDMVADALRRTGFDPGRLTLEITETYRISNLERAAEVMEKLRALGLKISMDDFGVGAASLEALLRLPFGELKIDRMFVSRMTSDPKAAGIVRNILQLGKDLRIIVVAEGVEDAATLTILRDSGCLVAQGFAISRPVEFTKILSYQKDSQDRRLTNMV